MLETDIINIQPRWTSVKSFNYQYLTSLSLGVLMILMAGKAHASDKAELEQTEPFVCDPKISLNVDSKGRFEVLKGLADEHGFSLEMLESENTPITLEKSQRLSKVVESITRDMSVVLKYKKVANCELLTEIAVIEKGSWDGSEVSGEVRSYQPASRTKRRVRVLDEMEMDFSVEALEKKRERKELHDNRLRKQIERRGHVLLNDELENGEELNTKFIIKDPKNWKKNIKSLPKGSGADDMETYVQDVLDGNREADLESLSPAERAKYFKTRRKLQRDN